MWNRSQFSIRQDVNVLRVLIVVWFFFAILVKQAPGLRPAGSAQEFRGSGRNVHESERDSPGFEICED